ncbi:hypothetical protein T4B_14113 [Trichinella pseudospiralis]|uniref:Uncharacterized protein n=1 Tax=Trichinella pseudospiralis TaxID=6337 RepID=A0A0V1K2Y5_TRIPS|nr:hypothetical protein T4A_3037 [Trichinella pseudospiralis]KRZ18526.1 hypothetical protein T4B_14113 [Trichinella pseudospiralis]KRZ41593.1 hypothetical protein T4C_3319 [Trichinella pseudospiralis]
MSKLTPWSSWSASTRQYSSSDTKKSASTDQASILVAAAFCAQLVQLFREVLTAPSMPQTSSERKGNSTLALFPSQPQSIPRKKYLKSKTTSYKLGQQKHSHTIYKYTLIASSSVNRYHHHKSRYILPYPCSSVRYNAVAAGLYFHDSSKSSLTPQKILFCNEHEVSDSGTVGCCCDGGDCWYGFGWCPWYGLSPQLLIVREDKDLNLLRCCILCCVSLAKHERSHHKVNRECNDRRDSLETESDPPTNDGSTLQLHTKGEEEEEEACEQYGKKFQ